MDKSGILGDIGGQLGGLSKQIGSSIVKTPVDLTKTAKKQAGLTPEKKDESPTSQNAKPVASDKETQEIVKSFYAKSDKDQTNKSNQSVSQQIGEQPKTQAEAQDLAKVRQQLQQQHKTTYYDPTFNPQKPKEEHPVEKIEREEKEKEFEFQKKEKKKPKPLAVRRAAQKTERYPGASG